MRLGIKKILILFSLLLGVLAIAKAILNIPTYQLFRGEYGLYNKDRSLLHQEIYSKYLKKSQKSPELLVLLTDDIKPTQSYNELLQLIDKDPNNYVQLDFNTIKKNLPEAKKSEDKFLQQEVLDLQANIFRRALLRKNSILIHSTKDQISAVLNLIYRYQIGDKDYKTNLIFVPPNYKDLKKVSSYQYLISTEELRRNIILSIYNNKDYIPTPIYSAYINQHYNNSKKEILSKFSIVFKGLKNTKIELFTLSSAYIYAKSSSFPKNLASLKSLRSKVARKSFEAEITNLPPNKSSLNWRISTKSRFSLNLRKDLSNNFTIISSTENETSKHLATYIKKNSRRIATIKNSIDSQKFHKAIHGKELFVIRSDKNISAKELTNFLIHSNSDKLICISTQDNISLAKKIAKVCKANKITSIHLTDQSHQPTGADYYYQVSYKSSYVLYSLLQILNTRKGIYINFSNKNLYQTKQFKINERDIYWVYETTKNKFQRKQYIVSRKELPAILLRHPNVLKAKSQKIVSRMAKRNLSTNLKSYGQKLADWKLLHHLPANNKLIMMLSMPSQVVLNQQRLSEYIKHIVYTNGDNTSYILNASSKGVGVFHNYIRSIADALNLRNVQSIGIFYPGNEMENIPKQDYTVIPNHKSSHDIHLFLADLASSRYLSKFYFWGLSFEAQDILAQTKKHNINVIWVKDIFLDYYNKVSQKRKISSPPQTDSENTVILRGAPPKLNSRLKSLRLKLNFPNSDILANYKKRGNFLYPNATIYNQSTQYTILQSLLSTSNQQIIDAKIRNSKKDRRPNNIQELKKPIIIDRNKLMKTLRTKQKNSLVSLNEISTNNQFIKNLKSSKKIRENLDKSSTLELPSLPLQDYYEQNTSLSIQAGKNKIGANRIHISMAKKRGFSRKTYFDQWISDNTDKNTRTPTSENLPEHSAQFSELIDKLGGMECSDLTWE